MTRRESILLGLGATAQLRGQQKAPYKVAIIGWTGRGGFGHGWDVAWRETPDVEIVAVSDPDEAGRKKAQQRSGAPRAYADYRQMLERERPNIVTIGPRYTDSRLAMVRAAAEIGAAILVEKPFASNLPDADELVAIAAQHNVTMAVGHQARASANARRVRDMIHNGDIGEIVEVRIRGKEDRRAGGEDLTVLGTHSLDLMRFLFGDPQWVFAHITQGGRNATRADARQGTEAVGTLLGDQIAAMFGFSNGLHVYFGSRLGQPFPPQDRCGPLILGTKGAIQIDVGVSRAAAYRMLRASSWMAGANAQWEKSPDLGPNTGPDFDRSAHTFALDFLDALKHQREPVCAAKDGRWTIEMISGIYQSHLAGAPVQFPLKDRRAPFSA